LRKSAPYRNSLTYLLTYLLIIGAVVVEELTWLDAGLGPLK